MECKKELEILKTDEDKNGYDKNGIVKMSNFIDTFANNSLQNFFKNGVSYQLSSENIADLNVLSSCIINGTKKVKNGVAYVPDFNSLPFEIKQKLKKGIYKLGISKQVAGNFRPTILNENGVRIKDITLKKVNANNFDFSNIQTQIQLKNISDQIESIKLLQKYQLERDRDSAIFVPFYDARDFILNAQNAKEESDRKSYLHKALENLKHAYNEAMMEINTNSKTLAELCAKKTLKQKLIDMHIGYISEDIQIITKIFGLQMLIYNYLEDKDNVFSLIERYKSNMLNFANDRGNKCQLSTLELIHDNCEYSSRNDNFWYNFAIKINNHFGKSKQIGFKEVVLVRVE